MPKVIVTVPPRPEFDNAYWALQRKFDSGATVLDVTDAQLAELQSEPVLAVTLVSDVLDSATAPAPAPDAAASPGKPLKR